MDFRQVSFMEDSVNGSTVNLVTVTITHLNGSTRYHFKV